ncbi:MAG: UvrB/UvrC motif-containing protein [Planctomycetota bacterium]
MNRDLTDILKDWPYEPGQLNVRIIEGLDGEPRLQLRLDLGVLQMTTHGRPDGKRPHGFESLLDYHESRLDGAIQSPPEEGPETDVAGGEDLDPEITLSNEECRELREEAAQYYHRYVALFVLDDFEGVVRDTTRNLRVLDMCSAYAEDDDDREALEPVRPYITMMRSRALAGRQIAAGEPKSAVLCIDDGIQTLKDYFDERDDEAGFERCEEVNLLKAMRDQLVPKLPVSQKAELRARMRDAISAENYELAAILRDELRQMGDSTRGGDTPRG